MSGREGCLRGRKGAWLAGAGWGGGGAGRGRGRPREATARGDRAGARAPIPDAETPTRRPALARARRGGARGRRLGRLRPNESRARRSKNLQMSIIVSLPRAGRGRTRQTATSSAAGFFGSAGGGSPGSFVGSGCSFWRAMARGGRAFEPRASKVWRCGRRSSTFSDPVRTPGVANRESRAAPLIAVDRGRSSNGGKTSNQKI